MNAKCTSLILLAAAAVIATGCRPDAAVKTGAVIDSKSGPSLPAAAAPSADAGEIKGTVHFTGKPPARVPIDMSMDPGCSTAGANLSEQYMADKSGDLANVYVYVRAGASPTAAAPGATAVVLDQKGCRYTPHVIAVQQGGSVEFHNSDPTMHNIHTMPAVSGNSPVDVSQAPMGQPQTQQFSTPEVMMPVRCNNHPWMNAFINVSPNQFFAVSASDGSFSIRGLPPGHYTLAAVHEKLGEQDMDVTISAHGTAKADFAFAAK